MRTRKDVAEFIGWVQQYTPIAVGPEPNGHIGIYLNGKRVRDADGLPITIAASPSDRRWRDNETAKFRRAGLVPANVRTTAERKESQISIEALRRALEQKRIEHESALRRIDRQLARLAA